MSDFGFPFKFKKNSDIRTGASGPDFLVMELVRTINNKLSFLLFFHWSA